MSIARIHVGMVALALLTVAGGAGAQIFRVPIDGGLEDALVGAGDDAWALIATQGGVVTLVPHPTEEGWWAAEAGCDRVMLAHEPGEVVVANLTADGGVAALWTGANLTNATAGDCQPVVECYDSDSSTCDFKRRDAEREASPLSAFGEGDPPEPPEGNGTEARVAGALEAALRAAGEDDVLCGDLPPVCVPVEVGA